VKVGSHAALSPVGDKVELPGHSGSAPQKVVALPAAQGHGSLAREGVEDPVGSLSGIEPLDFAVGEPRHQGTDADNGHPLALHVVIIVYKGVFPVFLPRRTFHALEASGGDLVPDSGEGEGLPPSPMLLRIGWWSSGILRRRFRPRVLPSAGRRRRCRFLCYISILRPCDIVLQLPDVLLHHRIR